MPCMPSAPELMCPPIVSFHYLQLLFLHSCIPIRIGSLSTGHSFKEKQLVEKLSARRSNFTCTIHTRVEVYKRVDVELAKKSSEDISASFAFFQPTSPHLL
uniref:Uncharacterized protein n=1 Tax=Micrurus spixii TaxID=129469 RepID=A0A2D4LCU3_9SAUR